MTKSRRLELTQAAICLLCASLATDYEFGLEGTELSGGWLTGFLLHMNDTGIILFILAMLLTLFRLRIAAAIILIASLCCLPLYLYFTAPGLFRWVFRGEYSVPLQTCFVWDKWAISGIVGLAFGVCIGLRNLLICKNTQI